MIKVLMILYATTGLSTSMTSVVTDSDTCTKIKQQIEEQVYQTYPENKVRSVDCLRLDGTFA